MFKKLGRDMKGMKKTQIKFSEVKTKVWDEKYGGGL